MAVNNDDKNPIRTRFAPSPTGLLHIGGARTALFNYLWARHNGGEFLLRFEDTDRARSTPAFAESIMRDLVWLGLVPDGEVVTQTDRSARHLRVLDELVARDAVYPCFCPAAEHACASPGVYSGRCRGMSRAEGERRMAAGELCCWRLAIPRGEASYAFHDRLHGALSIPAESIGDFVLTRADGSCTYLFAVVVDDHDAGVTHVIRGEEHISNTPRQELIYKALGWEIPEWVHIPMILDEGRHKLSKRSGAVSLASYRERGWDPGAIVAYLATMSWSGAPTDRISTLAELSARFSLDAVALSSPVHDPERLRHFGKLALASVGAEALLRATAERFPKIEARETLRADHAEMISELLPLCATEGELAAALDAQFALPAAAGGDAEASPWLPLLAEALGALSAAEWSSANIKQCMKTFMKERALKGSVFYHALRRLLTGRADGAPVALLMACLGKKGVLDRLPGAD